MTNYLFIVRMFVKHFNGEKISNETALEKNSFDERRKEIVNVPLK